MSNKKSTNKTYKNLAEKIKSLNFNYKEDILWKNVTMDDFINYVDSIDIFLDITETSKINTKDYKTYKIIGLCQMNKNLRFVGDLHENLYLITDPDQKVIYLSIGQTHPIFWYKVTSEEEFLINFNQIYETYNQKGYHLNHKSKVRAFMGTNAMLSLENFDIENHFLLHKYSEKLLWGSKWADYPYRTNYLTEEVSSFDSVVYTGHALQQDYRVDTYSVSVRSKYSKSIITIYFHEDAYIVEIKYDPIKTPQINQVNEMFGRFYKEDIPLDVILLLFNFPFIQYQNIFDMKPFLYFHFYIINLLISDDRTMLKEVEPFLKNLLESSESTFDDDLKNEINDFINYIGDVKLFEKIVNEIKVLKETHKDFKLEELLKKYHCMDNEYIKKCLDYYFN